MPSLHSILCSKMVTFRILVIHSLELQNPDLFGQHIEIDYIVLDLKTLSIIIVEVKREITLVTHKRGDKKEDESIVDKTQKQLQRVQDYISKWFGADISTEWKTVSFVFCLKISENEELLSTINEKCNNFVACNTDDFKRKLRCFRDQNQTKILSEKHMNEFVKDFKLMARYLIFGLSARKLVTTNTFLTKAKEIQEQASSWESVKMWCFLTAGQMQVLSEPKLVFLSGWGGGKTLTCIETAKIWASQKLKVIFLVNAFCKLKTLLVHYLELTFQDHKGYIQVQQINIEEDTIEKLEALVNGHHCLILDELPGDNESLTSAENRRKIQTICQGKEKVWAAISNFDKTNTQDDNEILPYIRDLFPSPDFHTFTGLNKNMRNPNHIHVDVQIHDSILDENERSIPCLTIQALNAKMESPPNMMKSVDTDPLYLLKKALTEKQLRAIMVARTSETAFMFHQVLQRLFYLDYLQITQWDGKTPQEREADLKKWIQWRPGDPGPNIVLTSKKLVNGFECEVIVSVEIPEARGGMLGDIMSRATCQRANFMDLLIFLANPNNGLEAKPFLVNSIENHFEYIGYYFTWTPKRWFQKKPELEDIFKDFPKNYTVTTDKCKFISSIFVATQPELRSTLLEIIPKLTWCLQLSVTEKGTNETKTATLCSGFRHEDSSAQIQWRAEAERRWYTPRKIVLPGSEGCQGSENIKFIYSVEIKSEFETCCKRDCSSAVTAKAFQFGCVLVNGFAVLRRAFTRNRRQGYERL